MRVINVERSTEKIGVYIVTLKPYWIEFIFGFKIKTIEVRDSGSTYTYGGGGVYYLKNGECLGNHNYICEAIDKFRNSW